MGGRISRCMSGGDGLKRLPRGYVPIAVGVRNDDTKRFMVHRKVLCDARFVELLCTSVEEYGFLNQGVLRIPYEAKAFEERMSSQGFRPNSNMFAHPST